MSALSLLPKEYGYVFAVLGGSFFMNAFLTVKVALARKKYNVQYPALYAAPGSKYEQEFNCVQRGHQNMLESYSLVMLQMSVTGLAYPITAAAFGGIWVIGRVIYGVGYATGGPGGRYLGVLIAKMGELPLAFMTMKVGYEMIKNL
jgi:glutathione S-transferase